MNPAVLSFLLGLQQPDQAALGIADLVNSSNGMTVTWRAGEAPMTCTPLGLAMFLGNTDAIRQLAALEAVRRTAARDADHLCFSLALLLGQVDSVSALLDIPNHVFVPSSSNSEICAARGSIR